MKTISFILLITAMASQGATLLNLYFSTGSSTYTGAAVVGDSGDAWTQWGGGNTSQTLGSVGVTVTGATDALYYATPNPVISSPAGVNDVMDDYLYSSGTLTVTLSGLDNELVYNFTAISKLDNYFNGSARTFTVDGAGPSLSASLLNNDSVTTFTPNVNYVTLSNVSPEGGAITLTLSSDVGLTALQVSVVPEAGPASLVSMAAAGLLLGSRRRG